MKILILMRHAKSSWNSPHNRDFDRVLDQRGQTDAALMGQQLAKRSLNIEQIVCSSAQRTQETAQAVANRLNYPLHQIKTEDKIYEASTQTLFYVLQSLDDYYNTVLLVGHNPAIHWLAEQLSPNMINEMSTAKMLGFQSSVTHWSNLQTGQNQLIFEDYPRLHRE